MIRLFKVFIPASVLTVLFGDTLIAGGALLAVGYLWAPDDFSIWLRYENGLFNVAIALCSIIGLMYLQDLYSYKNLWVRSAGRLIEQMAQVFGGFFVIEALLAYISRDLMISRWILLIGSSIIVVMITAYRLLFGRLVHAGLGSERILFLGASPSVLAVVRHIEEHPEVGMSCAGFVMEEIPEGERWIEKHWLGSSKHLKRIVGAVNPDAIAVGLTERRSMMPVNDLLDIRFSGAVAIKDIAAVYEAAFGRVSTVDLRPSQLIFSTELGPRRSSMRLQLLYSLLIAGVSLVVLAPIMLLVALAVKLTSPGPILYRQVRVGLNGVPFTVYKFRSMVVDAEAGRGAVWASKDDPRVTKIGRFLRKSRLDELPQLMNVMRGEMSIVGPRPERPEFVRQLSELLPLYPQRHNVRPGITGWAQINYKYGDAIEDTVVKLEYDLYYIKNLSLSLDIYIMFHTLKVMIASEMGQ